LVLDLGIEKLEKNTEKKIVWAMYLS